MWSLDPQRQIFQHWNWMCAWLDVYGPTHPIFTPVVTIDGETAGILPLVLRGRTLYCIGYTNSDYNTIIAVPERAATMLAIALEALDAVSDAWDVLRLDNVPEHSLLANAIQHLSGPWQARLEHGPSAPCPALDLSRNKQPILKETKDKLRKTARYLERLGPAEFRHLETRDEVAEHLPVFLRQHIRRQPFAGRTSKYATESGSLFCERLVKHLDPAAELRFCVLKIAGRPVAYHLGFEVNGKYLFYKPTFDVSFWDHSPGQVLLFHLFQYLEAVPVREFDLSLGGESYKSRFSNCCRQNLSMQLYSQAWRGQVLRIAANATAKAKNVVHSRPNWERAVRATREWLDTLSKTVKREGAISLVTMLMDKHVISTAHLSLYRVVRQPTPAAEFGITISTVTLADLADFAEDNGVVHTQRLHNARERLKRGTIAYMAVKNGSLAQVAWVRRIEGNFYEGISTTATSQSHTWVVEDCWQSRRQRSEVRLDLLRHIMVDAATNNAIVCIAGRHKAAYSGKIWRDMLRLEGSMHRRELLPAWRNHETTSV